MSLATPKLKSYCVILNLPFGSEDKTMKSISDVVLDVISGLTSDVVVVV